MNNANHAVSRRPCLAKSIRWRRLGIVATLAAILPASVYAIDASSPRSLKMKAQVQEIPITCTVGFDGTGGDTIAFGKITPAQIQAAPTGADRTLSSVFRFSNFNNIYDSPQPPATLKISCATISPPDPLSFQVQYGRATQRIAFNPAGINGFKLDSGPNRDLLAFGIYARDQNSSSSGRADQYVDAGQTISLLADSFKANAGRYSAVIQLFPALYWIDPANKNSAPGTITTSADFIVTIL